MLTTQILRLREKGKIINTGDFNAKLKVKKKEDTTIQEQSPNGIHLERMTRLTNMKVVSTTSKNGIWTRVNRNNPEEKSIIDYVMTDYDITDQIEDIEVDEECA